MLADQISLVIGLEDTCAVNKEQKLLVSLFEQASCGLKGEGLSRSKAEFIISTNLEEREERHVERILHIPMIKQEDLNCTEAMEASQRYKSVVKEEDGCEKPLDFVISQSSLVHRDEYAEELTKNTQWMMELLFHEKFRTSRNYAHALVMV